ncbi:MAG: hypothetical protein GY854_26550 [Deltaproteobacteria bacterium]|nr:hypothetical protein [Deltaproteobacteria bacterium]
MRAQITTVIIVHVLVAGCALGEWEVSGSYCDGDVLVAECQPEEGEEVEDDCWTETDCQAEHGVGCAEREPGEAQCGQKDPGCKQPEGWIGIHDFCHSETVVGRCSGDLIDDLSECPAGEVCYEYIEANTYYAVCIPTE